MGELLYLSLHIINRYTVFIIIFLLISYVLLSISLYLLFPKAGVDAVKGLIPGVNFAEWCKLIGRKPTYALLLLIPLVNIFIFCGMAVDLVRSFKQYKYKDTAAAVVYAPAKFYAIAKNDNIQYDAPTIPKEKAYAEAIATAMKADNTYELRKLEENNPYKKSTVREWGESLFFAVFAAAFIRMFLIEAYVIPTPSMEGSLNVGDYLFVSKAHYGIRMPQTVAMVPLLHNRIPILNTESYLKSPSLDYTRLPAITNVKRNDPFVFNWPAGDSVYLTSRRSYSVDQVRRNPNINDPELAKLVRNKDFISRPMDKTDFYIKRAVGLPGDKLEIKNRQLFINDTEAKNPKHLQFLYEVSVPSGLNLNKLDDWGIDEGDWVYPHGLTKPNLVYLDDKQVDQLKSLDPSVKVIVRGNSPGDQFPNTKDSKSWTVDNYGPLNIPAAGQSVDLTLDNLPMYRRIIGVYEHNDLSVTNGQIMINGEAADSYTFKQDYYWAMGDNRHASEDSRAWGFVPADHIVGKPLFIWFSTREGNIFNGINWDRIFRSANPD